jgi:hypothetical protein
VAVTEGTIGVTEGTGKDLDTVTVTQTDGGTTHREVVVLADPETLAAYAPVKEAITGEGYALRVTDVRLGVLANCLEQILTELKVMNAHLERGSDVEFQYGDVDR